MSRNVNSFFSEVPSTVDISRSKFIRNSSHKTSFNAGELIPFYVDEVLPGDTMSIDTSKVVRLSTLMNPIFDDMYLDTYYFFVPNRIVWDDWQAFMGENTQSAWIPQVSYSVPQLVAPNSTGFICGTIADYMGIPTGVDNISVNALPIRAYALICNEWFRDENLTDPLYINKTASSTIGSNGSSYVNDVAKGGMPFKVAKYADYFTKCLPAPQKGPDVRLPVFTYDDEVPVYAKAGFGHENVIPEKSAITFVDQNGNPIGFTNSHPFAISNNDALAIGSGTTALDTSKVPVANNLVAMMSEALTSTINEVRTAFQVQKMYEKDARSGTRYVEILKSHFGVTSPDARLQRPEYLGGSRIPVNITQVVQSSETANTPQGHTAAYSLSIDSHSDFTKSFVEHGFVIGVMCVRYQHTYQQGIERFWSRTLREDYYFPVFANIGEQAVLNKEIYVQGNGSDDQVFGYQEAWADYRYKPNRVSSMMRSNYTTPLDSWHLADNYSQLPSLSDSWIREDMNVVDRVLAVTSNVAHQFIADIYIKNASVRPMPTYSVPGLLDHH